MSVNGVFKTVFDCRVVVDRIEKVIPVDVYDSTIFTAGCFVPSDVVQEALAYLFKGEDPTKAVDGRGRRFKFGSVEECQLHLQALILNYMRSHGEMFRAPGPCWFDRSRLRICKLEPDSAFEVLYPLGFSAGTPNFSVVSKNLYRSAMSGNRDWPERDVFPLAYMTPDFSTIYIRQTEIAMVKLTADTIESLPLGTDNVLVRGDRLADMPPFDEVLEQVEKLRALIGNSTIRRVPGSPLTQHYKTRFPADGILSPQQAQSIALARFMFRFCASQHEYLWPIQLITGETGSGKSYLLEVENTILRGEPEMDSLPHNMQEFITYVTNEDYLSLDNVDSAFEKASDELINQFCRLSTGASVSIRVLYENNKKVAYSLMKHISMTARMNPFSREDVLRRVLHLQTAEGEGTEAKQVLLAPVRADRAAIFAEILIRSQNLIRAHLTNADRRYEYQTRMKEYERYTLIAADYEGSLDETRELWSAYRQTYTAAITGSNPLLLTTRLWLGQSPERASQSYSATLLHHEMKATHERLGLEFIYKNPISFGIALKNNMVALQHGVGMSIRYNTTKNTSEYSFSPTPGMITAAVEVYRELAERKQGSWTAAATKPRVPSITSSKKRNE